MNQNGVIKNLALALAVAAMPVAALGVTFSINGQTNFAVSGDVHYHTGTGIVEFQAPDRFFCFDFGSGDAMSGLTVKDDNGVLLMNQTRLSSALQYRTGNNEIRFQSSNATPCFFTDGSGKFGLFGDPSRSTGGDASVDCTDPVNADHEQCDVILGDKFQGFPELVIEYSGGFARDSGQLSIGDPISYTVTIRNDGRVPMQRGAFQELPTFGLLDTTTKSCTSQGGSCGTAVPGNLVRFENLSLEPNGGMVTLEITKTALQTVDVGTTIHFFAGVVSSESNSSNPVFDSRVEPLVIE